MFSTRVLALLALLVGFVHCYSWDFVMGGSISSRLDFYYNGTLTHTENISSAVDIQSITYDPVHNRVLFLDYTSPNMPISSFDLSTRKIQHLATKKYNTYRVAIAYDPVTQLLFWQEHRQIGSFSLKPPCSNNAVDGNLLFTAHNFVYDIAVDSCRGLLYWITQTDIERARFDGSEREVLINSAASGRFSLAIDQQTQKMYWIEKINENSRPSIESADFNGKNRTTLYYIVRNEMYASSLTVSKDFIYWEGFEQKVIWQLPKNPLQQVKAKILSMSCSTCLLCQRIAVNYSIKEQTQGIKSCEAFRSLILKDSARPCLFCFHGTEVSGESRCECTRGYTGERCDVSICQNYCLQGDCSVSAEGQPTCSCNLGYSGKRCEVNACHNYCMNNGVCSLNEEDEPVCECTADYEGVRCEVTTTNTGVHAENTMPQVLRDLHSEVKQDTHIREEFLRTLQFYLDKIDENAAKIQKCEKSMTDNLQNCDETTSKTQTPIHNSEKKK